MMADNGTSALDLSQVEYLLDPPDTVWEGILSIDHATWLEVKELKVIEQAEERVRPYSTDLTREAWLGLYASSNPLMRTPPAGMKIPHVVQE